MLARADEVIGFAADAHDCIMVQALIEPTGYKYAAGFFIPLQKARSPR